MGVYSDYLEQKMDFNQLTTERKIQLQRISDLRGGRDMLVYAADISHQRAPISIDPSDLLAINDQLSNLTGSELDIILETSGGSGEVDEDIVRLVRDKYDDASVIVPGYAKSAGTIIAMSCNEILMEPVAALGPIDAQLIMRGKRFSAHAFLVGFEDIKSEVKDTQKLNQVYIPILQGISPGELQHAKNAQNFIKQLVTKWLGQYHFRDRHEDEEGHLLAEQDKRLQAEHITSLLSDHNKWLTHGRSIKINDLRKMKVKITDYSK